MSARAPSDALRAGGGASEDTATASPDDDTAALGAQLGRVPRGRPDVLVRCNLGLPVVVRMPPVLASGEPFPTRYWLTCPLLHRRIARLEGAGEVRRMEALLDADEELASAMRGAHERYAAERDAHVDEDVTHPPAGGVAGIRLDEHGRAGLKCLHAHAADFLAGHENPVGERVAAQTLPAACPTACVHVGAKGRWVRNSDWREPPLTDC